MKRLLSIIIGYSLLLIACQENEAVYYEGEPDGTSGIYFAYYTSYNRAGSSITYNYNDTTVDNSLTNVTGEYAQIRIPVRLFGNVSEEDRPFTLKAIGGTVEEGKDYFLPEELVMHKGEAIAYVVVRIKKTDELSDGMVRYITLGLEENRYFKPYIKNHVVGIDTFDAQKLTIRYSMVYEEPFSWHNYTNNLGTYSHAKLSFMLSVMGWTYKKFTQQNLFQVSPTICTFTRMELQKRSDEGNPVRELDGSLMQLGPNYLVDYSAYE